MLPDQYEELAQTLGNIPEGEAQLLRILQGKFQADYALHMIAGRTVPEARIPASHQLIAEAVLSANDLNQVRSILVSLGESSSNLGNSKFQWKLGETLGFIDGLHALIKHLGRAKHP